MGIVVTYDDVPCTEYVSCVARMSPCTHVTSCLARMCLPDLPYCADLHGTGCTRIRAFVHAGGSYMGLCAGAYFGSSYCEFEKGHAYLEVRVQA